LTYNDFGEIRSKLERMKRNWPMIIENIMSTKFSALKISDSEDTARKLMVETGASCLPVISDTGGPLGVIWQADLLQRLQPIVSKKSSNGSKSKESAGPLSDVMRVEFETILSSSSLRDAAILLQHNNTGCLLVVTDNRLIGIVSPCNFLGVTIDLLQDQEELKFDDLDEDAKVGTLDEIDLGVISVDKPETEDWNQMDA
jgi:CBS domain-containing protein